MNYAGRFNSFILKGQNVFDAIKAYHEMDGITHLEFNYPEHFAGYDLEEIKKAMGDLKVNGLAVRWRNDFTNGDLTNPDPEIVSGSQAFLLGPYKSEKNSQCGARAGHKGWFRN